MEYLVAHVQRHLLGRISRRPDGPTVSFDGPTSTEELRPRDASGILIGLANVLHQRTPKVGDSTRARAIAERGGHSVDAAGPTQGRDYADRLADRCIGHRLHRLIAFVDNIGDLFRRKIKSLVFDERQPCQGANVRPSRSRKAKTKRRLSSTSASSSTAADNSRASVRRFALSPVLAGIHRLAKQRGYHLVITNALKESNRARTFDGIVDHRRGDAVQPAPLVIEQRAKKDPTRDQRAKCRQADCIGQ